MTGDELKRSFLGFFEGKGHVILPSSSLVPHRDPTLLLTSAGMVQIKPYFLGLESPPRPRLASCQKCFRTTDIDLVGDSKHLTFFEMLGNFSVGDYFKQESIAWAWEFVTRTLALPEDRLWVTIYLDDDESFEYWRGIGVPAARILRFGEKDNFWGPVGDSGPCGPCSEIHYDFGVEFGCGQADCKPNCECSRFSEIWNLVFTQYDQDSSGRRRPLPKPNIDTGMGLERTLAAIQGRLSPYETDRFEPIVARLCALSGKAYGENERDDRAIRIAAEHGRGIAFLIADGVMPGSDGRGYVLRRILRRASLFGRRLGLDGPFLGYMGETVVEQMGDAYPELKANRDSIHHIIKVEEEKFAATLDAGLGLVERLVGDALARGKGWLDGSDVFRLYDTYGFPRELTGEIAAENGLNIDWEGFASEIERQRERARASHKFASGAGGVLESGEGLASEFVGYDSAHSRSRVIDVRVEGQPVASAVEGAEVDIIVDVTPFYGEMGGQVGDTGVIRSEAAEVRVDAAVKGPADVVVHRGRVVRGSIAVGDEVGAWIDRARRLDIARNHTATHLLQSALRATLGNGVYQKGSLVEAGRLRFDFSHLAHVSQDELLRIQRQVNEWVRENLRVWERRVPYSEAIEEGAIALFEEKYGDMVRVMTIGDPAVSKELCGGTHVDSTGEIGSFLITGESSIGTGLHRIEGVTGREAESLVESRLAALERVAREVEGSVDDVGEKVGRLLEELDGERRKSLALERDVCRRVVDEVVGQARKVKDVTVLTASVPPVSTPVLREMGDSLRERLGSGVVVLATAYEGRPSFLAMVTPDLVAKGFHAGEIIKEAAKVTGGGGGGKPGMAQAGGKDASRISEALETVGRVVAGRAH